MAAHSRTPWWQRPVVLGGAAAAVVALVVGVIVISSGGDSDEPQLSDEVVADEASASPTAAPTTPDTGGFLPPAAPITSTVLAFPDFLTSTLTDLQDRPPPATTSEVGPGWKEITPAPIEGREAAVGVWTGTEVLLWGGNADTAFGDGAAYDVEAETWRALADAPLSPRSRAVGVWTGTEMIILGGQDQDGRPLLDGAAYNPDSDAWRTLAPGFGANTFETAAVWTGTEVFVAGAVAPDTGLESTTWSYDPATDTFDALEENPRPFGGVGRRGFMTEAGLFVAQLDQDDDEVFIDWFDVEGREWLANDPIPGLGALDVGIDDIVWTGTEFVIATQYSDGVVYNTETGAVEPIAGSRSTTHWPATLVDDHVFVGDLRFDPVSREWLTDVAYPPVDRQFPTVVGLDGTAAFVWGGDGCGRAADCGSFVAVDVGLIWSTPS